MDIRIRNLHKSYHDADRELTVINDLTADIPSGKSIAIVGASGIGKSTLLHLLGGLDHPSRGQIFFQETDLCSLKNDKLSSFRGQNIGFVFQFHHLLPEFDALENVSLPLIISGNSEAVAEKRAREILDKVGLSDRVDHRPSELSGGEQQRVAVARALVTEPGVVLADEPTGNLDVETAAEVQQLLLEINTATSGTLLIVTHSRELAADMDIVLEMLPGGELKEI